MRVYREKTEPLVGFYRDRDLLTEIDGTGSVSEVAARVADAVRRDDPGMDMGMRNRA